MEVLAEQLERIERYDAELGSVITLDAQGARRRAEEADKALATGTVWGPLHGVGVTIEDIHATAGMRSTFGGYRPFADHVPAVDATVVARLKAAGAIVVGKTNGPCIWGQESVFLPTLNPWNADRIAGGSSTDPAVAVAAGLTPFDIAADTFGSIQAPAHFCGVFGMRSTEHRVPLTGTLFIDPIRKFRVLTTGRAARPLDRRSPARSRAHQWAGRPRSGSPARALARSRAGGAGRAADRLLTGLPTGGGRGDPGRD